MTTDEPTQWANARLIAAAPETAAERDQAREQVKTLEQGIKELEAKLGPSK